MTRVKICGITNLEDARHSIESGADELGFNFYSKSPRCIAPGSARRIINKLSDGVTAIGVFVNESLDNVLRIAIDSDIDMIQLHGDESGDYAEKTHDWSGLEVIKAFRVRPGLPRSYVDDFNVHAILLDGYSPGFYGGTGEVSNWNFAKLIAANSKVYLAGGLNPQNVSSAVKAVRPYAVDVASGVESSPGKKDPRKVEEFIRNAKNA